MLTVPQRFAQGMKLNELAYRMKLRGLLIDQDRRKFHEERLAKSCDTARARFVSATSADFATLVDPSVDPSIWESIDTGEEAEVVEARGRWVTRVKKLQELFYTTFKLQPTRFSKDTGLVQLNEAALKDVVGNASAPIGAVMAARALLAFRENHKTLSTYVVRLNPKHQESFLFGGESVLHPTWNVLQARTGRWSCSDPNLQNIQKAEHKEGPNGEKVLVRYGMRDMFVARPGTYIVEGDYKQLEVRIIAALTGDEPLVNAFNNGLDVYRIAAADIFSRKPEEITKEQRGMAKIAVLAMNYGGGPPVIYEQLKLSFPLVTMKSVEHLYDRWKNAHTPIFAFQRRMFEQAKESGFVECPLSGRRLRFYLDRVVPTEAANFPIQGTAGDIINPASLALDGALEADEHILMQIHDALYVETTDPERTMKKMRECMTKTITFANGKTMKFDIDLQLGTCWGAMKAV